MKLTCDIHTHTIASAHAYGTIREMAEAASRKGIALLGMTEHGPETPGTCDPFYFKALDSIPRVLYGVHLLFGCELNVTNTGKIGLKNNIMKKLDYAVAGLHTCCYKDAGIEQNTDNVIAFMKHPKVFFISHPDDSRTPLNYERLAEAARDNHVALEVNCSSFAKASRVEVRENYLKMLDICEKLSVPIIVSSDAHDPSRVARFKPALQLLKELQFPEELILTRDEQAVLDFIGISREIYDEDPEAED